MIFDCKKGRLSKVWHYVPLQMHPIRKKRWAEIESSVSSS